MVSKVTRDENAQALKALDGFFAGNPKAALALSGGADSSLLLHAAIKAGCDVKPYFVKSQFQPRFELDDARRLCGELGVALSVIEADILKDKTVAANTPDRCYRCKKRIFGLIKKAAAADGYALVIDGTNASDDENDRPGMAALRELKVRSPLLECGITKAQVRHISRVCGLFTADKPSYACLATRVPGGRPITEQILGRIERAENSLSAMGFFDFRVRVIGDAARLQLPEAQLEAALHQRERIKEALAAEFSSVLLDLESR